jgi:hypothetical protein
MQALDKKHLDLLGALASLLFEKIEPGERFRNDRIGEWCKKMPQPKGKCLTSTNDDAIAKINTIHEELVHLDTINTIKGHIWPLLETKKFESRCQELSKTLEANGLDFSLRNLFHLHRSKLHRARGEYEEALKDIEASSNILKLKIDTHGKYLPRYNRNLILNKGSKSEILHFSHDYKNARSEAEEMLEMSEHQASNGDFVKLDNQKGFCPTASWALYHMCESHLAETDWDSIQSKNKREWTFTETFSQGHFKKWNVPTLLRVIGNDTWKQRYPDYHSQMVDLVWLGTANNQAIRMVRQASSALGRIRIKPLAPISAIALVAFLLLQTPEVKKAPDATQKVHAAQMVLNNEIITASTNINEGISQDFAVINNAIVAEFKKQALMSSEQVIDHVIKLAPTIANERSNLMIALNGNEHGVGVG